VDSGELFGLAGIFSSDLRAAFDRVSSQLAVLDSTAGLGSISVLTSPKVAESFFRLVEKLVACEVASADVFNKFSDIAKTATTGKKKGYAALWTSLYRDRLFWAEKDYADVFVAHRVPGSSSCNRNAGNSSPKTLLLVLEADEKVPSLYSTGKKDSQASRRS
jgi:hypothetical protein